MIIRPANPQDGPRIQAIEEAASVFPWSPDAIAQELANSAGLHFIAEGEGDGTTYGFLLGVVVADELCIHNLATSPEFQRRGIARLILETAMKTARARGALNAYLEVRSKNDRAFGLYKNAGFCVASVRKKYYSGDHDDALIMHKGLNVIGGGFVDISK